MRKFIVVLCVLVLLFTSTACAASKTTPKISAKDLEQDELIKSAKSSINSLEENKATKGSLNDILDKLSKITQNTDIYTRAEVNSLISVAVSNAVANLKADQSWITKTSSGSSSSSTALSDTDVVISTSGDLSLILERDVDNPLYIEDGDSQIWRFRVKNSGQLPDTSKSQRY